MREGVIVVPDADTLFGSATRALLIYLHYAGLVRLRWSGALLNEMTAALIRAGRMNAAQAIAHKQRLRDSVPDAELRTEAVLAQFEGAAIAVRSPKDMHVAACALAARQACPASEDLVVRLVTKNTKDFVRRELQNLGVELMHPDQFLSELFCREGKQFAHAFAEYRGDLRSGDSAISVLRRLAADGQVLVAVLLASASDAGDVHL